MDLIENKFTERHRREAAMQGALLLARSERGRHYREYRLGCGHEQEVRLADMRVGEFRCQTCLEAKHHREAADQGAVLLGPSERGKHCREYRLDCGHRQTVRLYNMRIGEFRCQTCLEAKHHREAADSGCKLLGKSERGRHYREYRLGCGHSQTVDPSAMRVGKVRCRICSSEKHHLEAAAQGCKLLSKSKRGCQYRTFKLPCGHVQDVHTSEMRIGNFACSTCGDHAWTRPSEVYLLEILAPGCMPFLKLGYSNNVSQRFRLYGLPEGSSYIPLKTIPFDTGEQASLFERAAHAEWGKEKINPPCAMESGSTECYPLLMKDTILETMNYIGFLGSCPKPTKHYHTTQPMNPIQR